MKNYNVIVKNQQVLISIDSSLFEELLDLAIYAKEQLKITEPEWYHLPELYQEMLKNHKKVMEKTSQLPQGKHEIIIN